MPDPALKMTGRVALIGLCLFVVALCLRVLFLQASADAVGPSSPYYKGDTPTWLDYASTIRSSQSFDLGLPLRPPGVAYLVALLWDGQAGGYLSLRLAWCFLGALTVALFFLALWRCFDLRVAVLAALIAAASSGLMIISTSVNNETPYLLLVIASFTLWKAVRDRFRPGSVFAWSMLNGLACLVRVEHVLFFALALLYLAWVWSGRPPRSWLWRQALGRLSLTLAVFLLALAPWHVYTWSQIERFNNQPLELDAAADKAYLGLEQLLAGLAWSTEANRELAALPVFSQRAMGNFVAATVAMRGGSQLTGDDFNIIDEAFGSRPEPVAAHPFVSVYGGLNFYLANNPWATGGFTRAPLDAPPPLNGGASSYPPFLVAGLPPRELSLSYPPHIEALNHGYRLGWNWVRHNPGAFLALVKSKLARFWSGISMGFTGYNLPLGLSGTRAVADMVVPDQSPAIGLWRWAGFVVLALGLWAGRHEPELVPWLLLAATKTITTVGFYGYAREGVVLIPVFALLTALLVLRGIPATALLQVRFETAADTGRWLRLSLLLGLMLVAVEGGRWISKPVITLDGLQAGVVEPFPAGEYRERQLRVSATRD